MKDVHPLVLLLYNDSIYKKKPKNLSVWSILPVVSFAINILYTNKYNLQPTCWKFSMAGEKLRRDKENLIRRTCKGDNTLPAYFCIK